MQPTPPDIRALAIQMRRDGKSYQYIASALGMSKMGAREICRHAVPQRMCPKCGMPTPSLNLCQQCVAEASVGPEAEKECEPTRAYPGTLEKINVLAGRFERGEKLHHPDDVYDMIGATNIIPRLVGTLGDKLGRMELKPVSVMSGREKYSE